jgi:serine/threonine protein phosphatase PrpC
MSFLKRLLGGKKDLSRAHLSTAPLDPKLIPSDFHREDRRHILVGSAHSAGKERSHDDDSLLAIVSGADGDQGLPDFGLFCVADGLGGYDYGHIASAVAVRTIAHRLTQAAFLRLLEIEPSEEIQLLDELVGQAFEEANQAVFKRASGGATTLTAALMLGDQLVIGHVGDTRAYSIRDGVIKCLTIDHSLIQQLIDSGTISDEEALDSPHRGVLWNAMGRNEDLKVDIISYSVMPGSWMLLCSDGLWGVLSEEEINNIVSGASEPQMACDKLVRTANEAGGPDNVTVILIKFPL